jgi:hypothetical protein
LTVPETRRDAVSDQEQLKATLRQLHQQLQGGEAIDPELQALLQQLSDDVASLTQPADAASLEQAAIPLEERRQSALDRLLGLTSEFEESHPQLAAAIGNVAAALSRIGI